MKKRDRRSPASLTAMVVARRSPPPARRMKRSRSDSCSSSTKISTTNTMPAVSSGGHTDVMTLPSSWNGFSAGSWISTSTGVLTLPSPSCTGCARCAIGGEVFDQLAGRSAQVPSVPRVS
jgi:hypothetical protein